MINIACWAWVADKCGCAYLVGGWSYGRLVHVSSKVLGIHFGWEGQGRLLTLDRLAGNGSGVSMLRLLIIDY